MGKQIFYKDVLLKVTLTVLVVACLVSRATAGDLIISVRDSDGALITNAVVTVTAVAGKHDVRSGAKRVHTVNQKDTAYNPFVSVVAKDTPVEFVNSDSWGHHVYSFSKSKRFDITVPANTSSTPIVFDKPGIVIVGCNIHDRMLAYIYVNGGGVPVKSDKKGRARFLDLEAGSYVVSVWHPMMKSKRNPPVLSVNVDKEGVNQREFTVKLKRKSKKKRKPYKY